MATWSLASSSRQPPAVTPITEKETGSGLGKVGITQLAGMGSNPGYLLFTALLGEAGAKYGLSAGLNPFPGQPQRKFLEQIPETGPQSFMAPVCVAKDPRTVRRAWEFHSLPAAWSLEASY